MIENVAAPPPKPSTGMVTKLLLKLVSFRLKTAQRRLKSTQAKVALADDVDVKLEKRATREQADVDVLERMASAEAVKRLCNALLALRAEIMACAVAPPRTPSGDMVPDADDAKRDAIIETIVSSGMQVEGSTAGGAEEELRGARQRTLARALVNHATMRTALMNPNKKPPHRKRGRPGKSERAVAAGKKPPRKNGGGSGNGKDGKKNGQARSSPGSKKAPRKARSAPARPGSEEGAAAARKAAARRAGKTQSKTQQSQSPSRSHSTEELVAAGIDPNLRGRALKRALRAAKFLNKDQAAAAGGSASGPGAVDPTADPNAIDPKLKGRAAKRATRAAKFRAEGPKKGAAPRVETGNMFVTSLDGGRADGKGGATRKRKPTPKAKKFDGATAGDFFAGGGGTEAKIAGFHPSWVAKRAKREADAARAANFKGKKKTFE